MASTSTTTPDQNAPELDPASSTADLLCWAASVNGESDPKTIAQSLAEKACQVLHDVSAAVLFWDRDRFQIRGFASYDERVQRALERMSASDPLSGALYQAVFEDPAGGQELRVSAMPHGHNRVSFVPMRSAHSDAALAVFLPGERTLTAEEHVFLVSL